MGQMREDGLIDMADRDEEERYQYEQDQLVDLMMCNNLNDIKSFLMKYLIKV